MSLSAVLKAFTEVQFLSVFGRLFHSLEAQTVKVLSPACFWLLDMLDSPDEDSH